MTPEEKMNRYAEAATESFKQNENELLSFADYYEGFAAGAEWVRTPKQKLLHASFRIIRDRFGMYRVEVLDQTCDFWYIVASRMLTLERAVEYCQRFEKGNEQ